MSDVNPNTDFEKKKRKRKKSEACTTEALKSDICKHSREDMQSLKDLLTIQKTSAETGANEHQKRAAIRLVCNLGGRLCYIRDSLELIKDSGVQVNDELEKDIIEIIYYRNHFVHSYMYQDDGKQKEFFLSFLNLQRYRGDGQINLNNIFSFLIKLEKSSIEKLSNNLRNKHVKEERKEDEDKKETSENNLSRTISCLEVALKESLYLESLKKESNRLHQKIVIELDSSIKTNNYKKIVDRATEGCIVNLCQAYLDFRKSLGKNRNPETDSKKKNIETDAAKALIDTNALGLLQTAWQRRKELAHLIELSNSETCNNFLVRTFDGYFKELLKNARALSVSANNVSPGSSSTQANALNNAAAELTKMVNNDPYGTEPPNVLHQLVVPAGDLGKGSTTTQENTQVKSEQDATKDIKDKPS